MSNYRELLDPVNIPVDDRNISDLIMLLRNLSKNFKYYNRENKIEGDFSSLLETDESFLISEISKFPIEEKDQKRLDLIARFDQTSSQDIREEIFRDYLELTAKMFILINSWHLATIKNSLSGKVTKIESAIELAIENRLATSFYLFRNHLDFFQSKGLIKDFKQIDFMDFHSVIWELKSEIILDHETDYKDSGELINNSFKKVILISSEIFESLYSLSIKSKKILNDSLNSNNNHKAHIGLLFSFLKLYNYVQKDVNSFSKKHLDFYYKKILNQKKRTTQAVESFINIEIEENSNEISLSKDNQLIAGQYPDGSAVRLQMEDDIRLNNVKVSELLTVFISRNPIFDFNSKFQLVSAIYFKAIANSVSEVNSFNSNEKTFSTLGREQNFLTDSEMTMNAADIGFMIASPVLKLERSDRKIKVDLNFTIPSISYLSDLIIDISNNTELNEEEVFFRIFSGAFDIKYTSAEGWYKVQDYEVLAPEDWTLGAFTILLSLSKLDPAFADFDKSLHLFDIDEQHPVLRLNLNHGNFYNSYSFLSSLELTKIDIDIEVNNLNKIKIYREGQLVDSNSDFDLLGPLAKYRSKFYLGCEELFNKKVTGFGLSWDFVNIPPKCKNIEAYYEAYNQNFKNDSFKIKLSALSDFNYKEADPDKFIFDLFQENEKEEIQGERRVHFEQLDSLSIKPNFLIDNNYLNEFSNDIETGLFKFELTGHIDGFGFDIYPKIYSEAIANKYDKKKSQSLKQPILNEPFAPKVNNFKVNYKAKSSLIFDDVDSFTNDSLENNSFYQISPFGIEKVFAKNEIYSKKLFYEFLNEGELLIGLSSKKEFSGINLMFEIIKSENTNYEFSRKIDWHYSSYEGWKKMDSNHVLYDQTYNLMKTGIISFRFPNDFSLSKKILNKEKFYLKACSVDKADQFSLIKSIKTNAIKVIEVISTSSNNRIEKLKANTVEGFEKKTPSIIKVNQPFDSLLFKIKEQEIDFYQRTSELLRHKNRPVTKWDIEKFILSSHEWLSHTICFNEKQPNGRTKLKILCLKRIENFQNIDEVKLSSVELNQVKETLLSFISPFSEVEIVNPIFEDLWIKCKIRFRDISTGRGIEKLNQDLLEFICNWRIKPYPLKNKIKKYDIIKFLKDQKHVAFITGISIIHFKQFENGSIHANDTAGVDDTNEFIEGGTPWSIIVPRNNHKIEIISKDEYSPPEPINYSELGINKDFLILKTQGQKVIKKDYVDTNSPENKKNLQFSIKI